MSLFEPHEFHSAKEKQQTQTIKHNDKTTVSSYLYLRIHVVQCTVTFGDNLLAQNAFL